MRLNEEQKANKALIEQIALLVGLDPTWAAAVAMVESSLGLQQKSPTGCRGVFQMSSIAMKDLLQAMDVNDDDHIDMLCGVAFLRLLLNRHKTIRAATDKFCDPRDRGFYWFRVERYMKELHEDETHAPCI